MSRKQKIAYYYDPEYTGFYYGADHPMKPMRMVMAHHLILGYGLNEHLEVYRPRRAQWDELASYHSEEYLSLLRDGTPEKQQQHWDRYLTYGLEHDCPVFPGIFDFCRLYAGASIEGAYKLNHGQCDIAINWAGGLHHGKKGEASGFCYVNDCVLGILELLKHHARVCYIDIDIHHGDGVEEAFYTTDRVLTVSFHLKQEWGGVPYYPGTGAAADQGEYGGRGYSLNVPLLQGIDDDQYHSLFKPIIKRMVEVFQPGAIVLQCGADSVVGDRLGMFNLTLEGHAEAVRYVKSFGIPMLVLGGGGYVKNAVARAWTMETAILTEQKVEDVLPENKYLEYFSPEYRLNVNRRPTWQNMNKRDELERSLRGAPGVEMRERPPDALLPEEGSKDEQEQEQVHSRLKGYVRAHFDHHLKMAARPPRPPEMDRWGDLEAPQPAPSGPNGPVPEKFDLPNSPSLANSSASTSPLLRAETQEKSLARLTAPIAIVSSITAQALLTLFLSPPQTVYSGLDQGEWIGCCKDMPAGTCERFATALTVFLFISAASSVASLVFIVAATLKATAAALRPHKQEGSTAGEGGGREGQWKGCDRDRRLPPAANARALAAAAPAPNPRAAIANFVASKWCLFFAVYLMYIVMLLYTPIAYNLTILILVCSFLGVGSILTILLFWGRFWRTFFQARRDASLLMDFMFKKYKRISSKQPQRAETAARPGADASGVKAPATTVNPRW
eukprot:scaffold19.g1785.t1